MSNDDLLSSVFEEARAGFLGDGSHGPAAILLKNNQGVGMVDLFAEDLETRDVVIQKLAGIVAETGTDAVIVIGEGWGAPFDPANVQRAVNSPRRVEYLMATLLQKGEKEVQLMAEILRDGDRVSLGPTERTVDTKALYLAPVYLVWGVRFN